MGNILEFSSTNCLHFPAKTVDSCLEIALKRQNLKINSRRKEALMLVWVEKTAILETGREEILLQDLFALSFSTKHRSPIFRISYLLSVVFQRLSQLL